MAQLRHYNMRDYYSSALGGAVSSTLVFSGATPKQLFLQFFCARRCRPRKPVYSPCFLGASTGAPAQVAYAAAVLTSQQFRPSLLGTNSSLSQAFVSISVFREGFRADLSTLCPNSDLPQKAVNTFVGAINSMTVISLCTGKRCSLPLPQIYSGMGRLQFKSMACIPPLSEHDGTSITHTVHAHYKNQCAGWDRLSYRAGVLLRFYGLSPM